MGRWFSTPTAPRVELDRFRRHVSGMADEDRIRESAHAAGGHLVTKIQDRIRSGPEEHHDLIPHIQTWDTDDNVMVGVHPDSEVAQRFKHHEWGLHEVAPRPVLRQSIRKDSHIVRRIFDKVLSR